MARARHREKRIEQVVAVIATALVLALFLWAGGAGLVEGILVYAIGGAAVWLWGQRTFWSPTLQPNEDASDGPDREPQESSGDEPF